MLLLAFVALLYAGLALVGAQFLPVLSAPLFALLVYILPLVINAVVVHWQKTNRLKWLSSLLCPAFSILFYIGLAKLALDSGAWSTFVSANTMSNSSISLDISQTPLDGVQLLFVSLVFYGVSLASRFLVARQHSTQAGGRYA